MKPAAIHQELIGKTNSIETREREALKAIAADELERLVAEGLESEISISNAIENVRLDSEAVFRQLLTPDFQSGAPR